VSKLDVLAGIVGSDGSIDRNQPIVKIINKNREFINSTIIPLIRKTTGINVKTTPKTSGFVKDNNFVINIYCKWLWKILQEKYDIPAGKKSEKGIFPKILKKEDKLDFLRGWFAGDGSVTRDRKRPRLIIWSKNRTILEWIKQTLAENQIESRIWFSKKKNQFLLTVGKKKSVELFFKTIEIPHPEKERKLKSLL